MTPLNNRPLIPRAEQYSKHPLYKLVSWLINIKAQPKTTQRSGVLDLGGIAWDEVLYSWSSMHPSIILTALYPMMQQGLFGVSLLL